MTAHRPHTISMRTESEVVRFSHLVIAITYLYFISTLKSHSFESVYGQNGRMKFPIYE
jgi:hypothetical protein